MPPRSRREFQDSSAHAAADVLCEFLEAAVHATLHRRGVYPEELFERVSLYGSTVQRSRHPELSAYIADVVGGAHGWVCRGAARCLELVVTSAQHAVLERHVFQFELLGAAATAAEQLAAGTLPLPAGADADSEPAAALERRLAELLVVQAQRDAWREALPADCTFRLVVHTTERGPDADVLWVSEGVVGGPALSSGSRREALAPATLDTSAMAQRPLFHLELRADVMLSSETDERMQD